MRIGTTSHKPIVSKGQQFSPPRFGSGSRANCAHDHKSLPEQSYSIKDAATAREKPHHPAAQNPGFTYRVSKLEVVTLSSGIN